ncbi:forespore regulator of the sigma-K checkpoint [Cytobacillus eiseniae]|uniref:Forespore regulator of the sigma-K checkpoint n=1 Tax=Cytobacillus eiseniae TaxID=762947 RepID=A0ABS4RCE7_9BACI|nr:BofC C-terminal domain-containing protein [Cytobacillus eiseniae]MBP2240561.1 forespore regulator of the sigma-K checkpoint [Cytobacillus eiseniae]
MRTKWVFAIFVFLVAILYIPLHSTSAFESVAFAEEPPQQMNVILERVYVDGDISQESVIEWITKEELLEKYGEWQLASMDDGKMIFRIVVDDISPLLKANGYFGITDEGVLTIFNGRPQKANIIQSFFQIDLGRLESKKCEELKKGIPIKTKEKYVEVLETFKTYSKFDKQAK